MNEIILEFIRGCIIGAFAFFLVVTLQNRRADHPDLDQQEHKSNISKWEDFTE